MSEKSLEQRIEALELDNRRLHAAQAVQNLMSKMCYLQESGLFEDRYHCLAQKTPGVSVEIGARGVFEGYEHCYDTMVTHEMNFVNAHHAGVKETYPDREFPTPHSGMLESTVMGTPVIEVAGDCKTARGQWMAMMIMAKSRGDKPESAFIWWKYAADFVMEDGQWKVWHLRMDPMTMDELNFAIGSERMPEPMKPGTFMQGHVAKGVDSWPDPDKPITRMYYSYRPWTTVENYPTPPEPYGTFDDIQDW